MISFSRNFEELMLMAQGTQDILDCGLDFDQYSKKTAHFLNK